MSTSNARMQKTGGVGGVIQMGPSSNILIQGGQFVQNTSTQPVAPVHNCYDADGAQLLFIAPLA